ncbi:MAG: heparinase II/III family protein [Tepidisphaeraceae bacterium]
MAKFGSAIVLRRGADSQNFLAVRTGSTADHHSHLDLGNFVLDLAGERFAHDLGADNYGLPGYLGPRRADYLRSNTPGHNTLTIGEASQPLEATATATVGKADGVPTARVVLTDAYPGARSVVRNFELKGDVATIVDDVILDRSANLVWHLHTPAKVKKTERGFLLDANGKRAELRVLSPADFKLSAEPDVTQPPEQPVENSTHLRVKIPSTKATSIVIEIRLVE